MNIKLGLVALLSVATLWSCGDDSVKETNDAANQNLSLPATVNTDSQTTTNNGTKETVTMPPVMPAGNIVTSGKLNPAHGQPGHRCDIADGAPLDGSPAPKINLQTPTLSTQTTTPTQPVTITPSLNNSGKPADKNLKLNPAHGQPGHKCEIAVGAPLDGTSSINNNIQTTTQPVAVTPTQNNQTQPAAITTTTTPITTTNAPANKTAATNLKLNPAHGEPGHRCDISVGAPLDGSSTAKAGVSQTSNKSPLQYFQPTPTVVSDKKNKSTANTVKTDTGKN